MIRKLVGLVALTAVIGAPLAGAAEEPKVEIKIACGTQGQDLISCQQGVDAWAKATGNKVSIVPIPTDSSQQLTLFQQLLAAGSTDVDVFRIDVVWPAILANNLIDLHPYFKDDELKKHFAAIVQTNLVNGKLVGIPWFTDAGLLYYRKDLLEKHGQKPPATWAELATIAKLIQDKERAGGNPKMSGIVFQGKAYEGLTCNALEWIDAFGGGTIVGEDGKVTIDNPKAAAALEMATALVGSVAPKGVLNYDEEASRGVFQSGQAVFMRNWPYAWALSQSADSPVKGKVGVAPLPRGSAEGKTTGTLGGWQLGVSKFSKNPKQAVELVRYLTSLEEQKRRAIVFSYNPTVISLYKDPDVLKANPFYATLLDTFTTAVARPSKATGLQYSKVSAEFRNTVHAIVGGKDKAAPQLKTLQTKLEGLSNGGKW